MSKEALIAGLLLLILLFVVAWVDRNNDKLP